MPLDTLDNVKAQLGVATAADDGLLARLQAEADGFVADFCRRAFAGGAFTEDHPGGARYLFLRNFPVAEVTAVKVDPRRQFGPDTVLDPARYVVGADRGVVESLGGPFVPGPPAGPGAFPGAVRVTYSTPTGAVPGAVCRAYAELIGHWYRQAKTAAATGQCNVTQKTDGAAGSAFPWAQSGGFRVPAGVRQLLELYRVPGV